MARRPILQHPDPVLRALCTPVTAFDADLRALAEDMLDTMYAAPGRGLAAPQIGVTQRIFVMDVDWKTAAPAPGVYVNPELVQVSEDTALGAEGCLSLDGIPCTVRRPIAVRLRWQDLEGAVHQADFDGFAARCVQHERDHLDGVLCIDYAEDDGGATP